MRGIEGMRYLIDTAAQGSDRLRDRETEAHNHDLDLPS